MSLQLVLLPSGAQCQPQAWAMDPTLERAKAPGPLPATMVITTPRLPMALAEEVATEAWEARAVHINTLVVQVLEGARMGLLASHRALGQEEVQVAGTIMGQATFVLMATEWLEEQEVAGYVSMPASSTWTLTV